MRSGGTSWAGNAPDLNALGKGWGAYQDTQYSEQAPLALLADEQTPLPNNAGNAIVDHIPADMDVFYDPITGRLHNKPNCDFTLACRIYVRPTSIDTSGIRFQLDIGTDAGPQIVIDETSRALPWGVGVVRRMTVLFSGYSRTTFAANGARLLVTAEDGPADIWGMSYVWKRMLTGASA